MFKQAIHVLTNNYFNFSINSKSSNQFIFSKTDCVRCTSTIIGFPEQSYPYISSFNKSSTNTVCISSHISNKRRTLCEGGYIHTQGTSHATKLLQEKYIRWAMMMKEFEYYHNKKVWSEEFIVPIYFECYASDKYITECVSGLLLDYPYHV